MKRTSRRFVLAIAAALVASGPAFAADPAQQGVADLSKDQRQKMAEAHRRMADCLESDRSWAECHAEMHATCRQQMGGQGCPMMGGGMGPGPHGGMGMGRGMGPGPGTAPGGATGGATNPTTPP